MLLKENNPRKLIPDFSNILIWAIWSPCDFNGWAETSGICKITAWCLIFLEIKIHKSGLKGHILILAKANWIVPTPETFQKRCERFCRLCLFERAKSRWRKFFWRGLVTKNGFNFSSSACKWVYFLKEQKNQLVDVQFQFWKTTERNIFRFSINTCKDLCPRYWIHTGDSPFVGWFLMMAWLW